MAIQTLAIRLLKKRNLLIVASLISMSFAGKTMAACDLNITDNQFRLNNFDTFSNTQAYSKNLKINYSAECEGILDLTFAKQLGDNKAVDPHVFINYGQQSLFNTDAGTQRHALEELDSGGGELTLPLGFLVETEQTVLPAGDMSRWIKLNMILRDSDGVELTRKSIPMTLTVEVDDSIHASFYGAGANGLSADMPLNLNSYDGSSAGKVDFTIKANVSHQINITSEKRGKLVHDEQTENYLTYVLSLDGSTNLDISAPGGVTVTPTLDERDWDGNNHRLDLYLMSDPRKVRAGHYSDVITMDITPNS